MTIPASPSVPSVLSVDAIQSAILSGQVWPGDCVLYRYAKPDWTQRMIARTQARALADLQSEIANRQSEISHFTHAGMVAGRNGSIEMTSPRCRIITWADRLSVQPVAEIAIVRPAAKDSMLQGRLHVASKWATFDANRGVPYPYREILLYWLWSWNWRKLRGNSFERVFRSRTRNVCSGSVIQWWQDAGIDLGLTGLDTWPEAWYPARMLVDPRFATIAQFTADGQ